MVPFSTSPHSSFPAQTLPPTPPPPPPGSPPASTSSPHRRRRLLFRREFGLSRNRNDCISAASSHSYRIRFAHFTYFLEFVVGLLACLFWVPFVTVLNSRFGWRGFMCLFVPDLFPSKTPEPALGASLATLSSLSISLPNSSLVCFFLLLDYVELLLFFSPKAIPNL